MCIDDEKIAKWGKKGESAKLILAVYTYLCLTDKLYFIDGNLEFYRIPGVLQRFGVCYLFVAMMQLLLSPTNNREKKVQDMFYVVVQAESKPF